MPDRAPVPADRFAELRSIIVGPEQRKIRTLQRQMRDPAAQTRDVSRVLPDALELRAHDPQLMRALAPSVEEAITSSVRKNPQALADALFPVIGPAIRKAVAHTFDSMIDSLNQSIERSVSWQAVRWRWTAWRTGQPFAEIVLAHTLAYRVEQVFLIHGETGLLLQHVAIGAGAAADADQISAMLTAITDFARDSFQVGRSETLESMRIGDLAVTIVQGPHAILAAVVRGSIPPPVRATFESALESVHRQFGEPLQAYSGDASAFEGARPLLEACLLSQRRHTETRPSYRGWAIAAAILAVGLGIWLVLGMRERQRWNAYVERLRAEPGLMLLETGRRGGSYFVTGLRDPLARDPADLVPVNLASTAFQGRWEPYQSLQPAFVTVRATRLLRPPDGVTLSFDKGTLTASGAAPQQWVDDSSRLALAIAGVSEFRFAGNTTESVLVAAIERSRIGFAKGSSAIEPPNDQTIAAVIERLRNLDAALATSGRQASVEILGYTDTDGPDTLNTPLSQTRADRVKRALESAALKHVDLTSRGLGRAEALPGATDEQQQQNRRVSFVVHLTGAPSSRSTRQ